MRTFNTSNVPWIAIVASSAMWLSGCSNETKPPTADPAPATAPTPVPAPESSMPASPAPDAPAPDATPAPDAMPADPAPPGETPPPPTDPSATAKPTAAQVPDLESMRLAKSSGKLGVAADVRYSFDAAPAPGETVTLNIAVVPRVAGQALDFSLQPAEGVRVAAGPVTRLKVGQADSLRQQYSLTRAVEAPRTLRVLVTHQWDGGSAFGFYSIPFD
jgi:hypothetical protein